MKLSLVVMATGKMEGKALDIKLSQFVIGRDPQCQLRPASPLISKRHCAILQRDGKAFIRDFGSTNGTFLNDQPVTGEAELHHDDRLKIGPLLFAVRLEAGAPVNQSTPPPATKPAAKPAPAPAKAPAAAAKPPAAAAKPGTGTPVPAKAPQPAAPAAEKSGGGNDDDIAAMLLSLQDDEGAASAGLSADSVPDGSTVMDLVVPPGGTEPGKTDKEKEKKPNIGNTSNAAKSILEKYMRRPRNP